jgi:hypothetical protein
MPPKVNKEAPKVAPAPVQPKVVTTKKEQPKQKPKQLFHDFVAAQQKLPPVLDADGNIALDEDGNEQLPAFFDALSFYEDQFMKEMCVSRQFMDQESSKRYLINPRTGSPYDSYVRSYQFKYNKDNSVKYGDRTIGLTRFLTNEQFCNRVIAYYRSMGYHCEIYQTSFDKAKQRYSKVCVKVYFQ